MKFASAETHSISFDSPDVKMVQIWISLFNFLKGVSTQTNFTHFSGFHISDHTLFGQGIHLKPRRLFHVLDIKNDKFKCCGFLT